MNYYISASTDVGNTRKVNQDSALVRKVNTKTGNMVFAVVCDGMGGLSHGEIASASLVCAFSDWFYKCLPDLSQNEISDNDIRKQWSSLLSAMNNNIKTYGERNSCRIGSTVTAMLITDYRYFLMNVGDSRAYRIKDDVRQLTQDHTLTEHHIKLGNMTREQAATSPMRSVLTRCIGAADSVNPDYFFGDTEADSVYMLCSDGFRHKITNDEFKEHLYLKTKDDPKSLLKKQEEFLINLNKERNESDNITVISVAVQ